MIGHEAVSRKGGTLGGVFGPASSECARSEKDMPREKKERPDYVSLRVTPEEKNLLTRDAAGMSLSAYVRERLFGEAARPRKTRGKYPVKDHEALARVLGRLGRSNLHNTLYRLILAVEEGRAPLESELEADLRQTLAAVEAMRGDLVTALGLKAR